MMRSGWEFCREGAAVVATDSFTMDVSLVFIGKETIGFDKGMDPPKESRLCELDKRFGRVGTGGARGMPSRSRSILSGGNEG